MQETKPISPGMTDAEAIRALAQISRVRALFTGRPIEERTPVYTLPATPRELARLLHAGFVTPRHAVYDSCTAADVIAEVFGTGWGTVDVFADGGFDYCRSEPARYEAAGGGEDAYPYDDTPGAEEIWRPDFGVDLSAELAKLVAYLYANRVARGDAA